MRNLKLKQISARFNTVIFYLFLSIKNLVGNTAQ